MKTISKPNIPLAPLEVLAPGDLLTPAEAAQLLRTSEGQLSQLRFRKEGPAFLKFGRKVLYRRIDLVEYTNQALVTTTRIHRIA